MPPSTHSEADIHEEHKSRKPGTVLGFLTSEERKAQSALTTCNKHKEKIP